MYVHEAKLVIMHKNPELDMAQGPNPTNMLDVVQSGSNEMLGIEAVAVWIQYL